MSPRFVRMALVAVWLTVPAAARAQDPDAPTAPPESAEGDVPAVEAVTFDAAVQRALDRNPTALQAAAEIRRYRALVEEVRSASLPTLVGTGVYTRLDANRTAGALVLQPDSSINLSVTLTVPIVNARG